MKTDIIVSYHRRPNNIKQLLRYLIPLLNDDLNLIIVEQNHRPTIKFYHKYIKYYFIEIEGVFNKGKGYNYGVKMSDADYIILHDCDIILKKKSYLEVKELENYDVIDPYLFVVYLTEQSTTDFVNNDFKIDIKKENIEKQSTSGVVSGGVCFIRRDKFIEIKGFDEDCYGYGYEDDIFDTKIKKMNFKIHRIKDACIHLWHPVDEKDNYYSFKTKNRTLFNKYINMNRNEIKEKINNTKWIGL